MRLILPLPGAFLADLWFVYRESDNHGNQMKFFEKLLFEPDSKVYSSILEYSIAPKDVSLVSGKETLHGWYFSAQDPEAILLQFHGNAENLSSHAPYVGWLAEHGISVLCFDYAGYGKSSGKPSIAQVRLDSRAALTFAQEKSRELRKPLLLLCQSIGSQFGLSALARAEDSNPPRLIILEGAFPSIRALVRSRSPSFFPAKMVIAWVSKLFPTTEDATSAIPKIASKFLVIHSKTDQIVPLRLGLQLAELLNDKQKRVWIVDGPRHLKTLTTDYPELRQEFLQLLRSELRNS